MSSKKHKQSDADAPQQVLDDAIDALVGDEEPTDADNAEARCAELADRNLRLQAEMENLRQRTSREVTEERRYAAMSFVRDLLDVVDNVDRAIEAAETTADADSLLAGFQLVAQQLQTILSKHHCVRIKADGVRFDPNVHEAIQQMRSEDQPSGNVMLVTQAGYQLHGRVVRPSQVIVSTGPNDT